MNLLRYIDELEQIVENSTILMANAYVKEEPYLTASQRVRAALPIVWLPDEDKNELLGIMDEIDQLMIVGTNFMGKRAVPQEKFYTLIQQLRTTIPRAMKKADDIAKGTLSSTPTVAELSEMRQIGLDELLLHVGRVLSELENGQSFSIIRDGKIVARLFPPN